MTFVTFFFSTIHTCLLPSSPLIHVGLFMVFFCSNLIGFYQYDDFFIFNLVRRLNGERERERERNVPMKLTYAKVCDSMQFWKWVGQNLQREFIIPSYKYIVIDIYVSFYFPHIFSEDNNPFNRTLDIIHAMVFSSYSQVQQ